jgi:hypothetical protein
MSGRESSTRRNEGLAFRNLPRDLATRSDLLGEFARRNSVRDSDFENRCPYCVLRCRRLK